MQSLRSLAHLSLDFLEGTHPMCLIAAQTEGYGLLLKMLLTKRNRWQGHVVLRAERRELSGLRDYRCRDVMMLGIKSGLRTIGLGQQRERRRLAVPK